ncbi:helix-turn-helix transcriptional regulator [Myceligenerans xiligouense]|uniref:AraC-like DNA-binding protein n=1 Tax=Myceligenerans xiligouense TaxID=253184 RepID=A0A3N4Z0V4_9MICO|nr:AraC family transcriptional regulator [Myceligenerans xiligouense]RPF19718.1 AraC-like DNA-binding protein [Myceligenerans xiligouense]
MTITAHSATISAHPSTLDLAESARPSHPTRPGTRSRSRSETVDSPIEDAVRQAVQAMTDDLGCDEGIASIAAANFYSKFHFTREFSRITGTTPRRYLAALRMQRAKELLLQSDLGVVDVSTTVGYMSVGTFSSRFSALVGVSPREWRRLRGLTAAAPDVHGPGRTVLRGRVQLLEGVAEAPADVFVAVYEDSVIQGLPVACTRATTGAVFELRGVPAGSWVVSVLLRFLTSDGVEALRDRCQVTVSDDPATRHLPLRLQPSTPCEFDPPVIFSGVGSLLIAGDHGRR